MDNALARWHRIVEERSAKDLDSLLSGEVVFYSPVVHTPQVGKPIAMQYLAAAIHVFGNETFRYVREIVSGRDAALEFAVEIEGIQVNGVDLLKWNEAGQIVELKVMLRPLKAVNLIHQKMVEMLAPR